MFGRERTGLTNAELGLCGQCVRIPTDPTFSSLNLAAAVQLLAYELRLAWLEDTPPPETPPAPVANVAQLEGFFRHLEQTLLDIEYADAERSRSLTTRLRNLFQRARPDPTEINILRGLLSAAQAHWIERIRPRRAALLGGDASLPGQTPAQSRQDQESACSND